MEMVLLIVWVMAILGDNPMQSELASHIGLAGKYFCRVCKVKGADTEDKVEPIIIGGRKKKQEGMAEMKERISRFLKV